MNKNMTSSYKTPLHSSTTVIKAQKEKSKGGKDDNILPVKWEEINYWKTLKERNGQESDGINILH